MCEVWDVGGRRHSRDVDNGGAERCFLGCQPSSDNVEPDGWRHEAASGSELEDGRTLRRRCGHGDDCNPESPCRPRSGFVNDTGKVDVGCDDHQPRIGFVALPSARSLDLGRHGVDGLVVRLVSAESQRVQVAQFLADTERFGLHKYRPWVQASSAAACRANARA